MRMRTDLTARVVAASIVAVTITHAWAATGSAMARCRVDLQRNVSDCAGLGAIQFVVAPAANKAVMRIDMSDYEFARFDVSYQDPPATTLNGSWMVNIGDSATNDGWGGDAGTQSNDGEIEVLDDRLDFVADDYYQGNNRMIAQMSGVAPSSQDASTLSLTVRNNRVEVIGKSGSNTVTSPNLFALAGQADNEGPVNHDVYAAFNRTINNAWRAGSRATAVVVTLGNSSEINPCICNGDGGGGIEIPSVDVGLNKCAPGGCLAAGTYRVDEWVMAPEWVSAYYVEVQLVTANNLSSITLKANGQDVPLVPTDSVWYQGSFEVAERNIAPGSLIHFTLDVTYTASVGATAGWIFASPD